MENNNKQALADSLLAGVQGSVDKSKNFRETLRDLFNPGDYVNIKNPFKDKETGWVYTNPQDEKEERPDRATRRIIHGQPQVRVLKVGETVVIPGWEAYIALIRMFKEYAQDTNNISITLGSNLEVEKFLKLAYGGVYDPNEARGNVVAPEEIQPKTDVSDDIDDLLGFNDSEDE